jgi:hypothetical protein
MTNRHASDAATGAPTEIVNWHDLDAVRGNLDGDYVLVADLDSETDGYEEHVDTPSAGWAPLGGKAETGADPFAGTFDGNGHEIADLFIDRPDAESAGLFGGNEGVIDTVTVTNVTVTGQESVGALAGENSGRVTGASASGTVTGGKEAGGLVGVNLEGEVVDSSASCTLTGDDELVAQEVAFTGGLVSIQYGEKSRDNRMFGVRCCHRRQECRWSRRDDHRAWRSGGVVGGG